MAPNSVHQDNIQEKVVVISNAFEDGAPLFIPIFRSLSFPTGYRRGENKALHLNGGGIDPVYDLTHSYLQELRVLAHISN